jgi:uncharacterized delta-60 repeat protein
VSCALAAAPAAATPGDYDFAFGGIGFVPNRFGDNSDIDTARDVAGQSDGKVVVVGDAAVANQGTWVVARYTVGGALDPTFGKGGAVRDTVVDDGALPWSVAIQPDGKLVVGGVSVLGANARFAFVRYLPDGSLDPSFDGDGKTSVAVKPADNQERVQALEIAPDGKIVAVGRTNDGVGVVRLNSNGSPDSTFDGDGSKDLAMANANTDDVAVQPDGSVVIPIATGTGAGDHFTIVRLDNQGVPDGGFGTAGTVPLPVGDAARSTTAAIQPDGKIVVGGYAKVGGGDAEFAIARLNQNGTPDMSFDGDGQEITPLTGFEANAQSVMVQANGKILLAGVTDYDMAGNSTLGYVRYNSDGGLDSTFLGGGALFGALPTGWVEAFPSKSALACDGKILTVGRADLGAPHEQFFTARLLGDPIPCPGLNPPAPPPGTDKTKPHSRIRKLSRVVLASKLKRFAGTASDDGGVKKVEIALLRRVGKVAAFSKRQKAGCLWLRNSRAKFKKVKPRRGKCAKPRFLRAKGTKKWAYKLRKHLPPGKYILYARATDTSGNRETSFTAKRGNRKAFRVRAG